MLLTAVQAQGKQKEPAGGATKAQLFGYSLTSCNQKTTEGHTALRLIQKTLALSWSCFSRVLKSAPLLGKQKTERKVIRESTEKLKKLITKDLIF